MLRFYTLSRKGPQTLDILKVSDLADADGMTQFCSTVADAEAASNEMQKLGKELGFTGLATIRETKSPQGVVQHVVTVRRADSGYSYAQIRELLATKV